MATAADYDAPRRREIDETPADPLREVASGLAVHGDAGDEDAGEFAELFELPGADLSGEELVVRIIPKRADEFTCSSCFLVYHRSRLATSTGAAPMCADCA